MLLVGLYFAYWHDGFIFGPRFRFPLAPVARALDRAISGARARAVRDRAWDIERPGTDSAVAVALAAFVSIPARVREYCALVSCQCASITSAPHARRAWRTH